MIAKLKPVIVLASITAIISALIIITYNVTYVDTTNLLTEKQAQAVISIYGGTEADYEVVPREQWENKLALSSDSDMHRVQKVIKKSDGSLAFEVVVKGYKEGYDLLVGVKDDAVAGVAVISTGEETPGLGTKTADSSFLELFKGKESVTIVKGKPESDNEIQAVTSATYSSKGVAQAVNIALSAYKFCGGEL